MTAPESNSNAESSDIKRPNESSNSNSSPNKRLKTEEELKTQSTATEASRANSSSHKGFIAIEADAAEDRGSRHTMEDAWVVLYDATLEFPGNLRCAHFAIYDGHGGRSAAEYAQKHLHVNVLSAGLPRELMDVRTAKKAILNGFLKTDEALLQESAAGSLKVSFLCYLYLFSLLNDFGSFDAENAYVPNARVYDVSAHHAPGKGKWKSPLLLSIFAVPLPLGEGKQDKDVLVDNPKYSRRKLLLQVRPSCCGWGKATSSLMANPQISSSIQFLHPNGMFHLVLVEFKLELCEKIEVLSIFAFLPSKVVFVANIGDAKAVVARSSPTDGSQSGPERSNPLKAIVLTREHKAIYPQERARIQKAGGSVGSNGRLQGRLEVSRAFGDRQFKKVVPLALALSNNPLCP
ncbi:putative protein phosphatase 2C 67 [Sesamum angolense]|uniref:PPM-type phosphatase domain-containing protein n=1 Tax=Sesamum angolense TaxID=2727404 RepID=A0AAE2C5N4_9LAMI|nr:putative protein phosphatase 2C 67 [Sesamum angolense]